MKKTPQKTNKEFRVEKVIIEKAINYMLNGKATIIILTAGLIKRTDINWYKWVNVFQNENLQEKEWKLI